MVYLIGNTSWRYCFQPETFPSKNKAIKYGRWMVNEGFWFAYRIIKHNII